MMGLRSLSLLFLALIAACFTDTGFQETHGARGPVAGALAERPLGVRAAYVTSAQQAAGPEYHFNSSAVAANAAQGLTAESPMARCKFASRAQRAGSPSCDGLASAAALLSSPSNVPVHPWWPTIARTMTARTAVRSGTSTAPLGIEQGFELSKRPSGASGGLVLHVEVGADLQPTLSSDGALCGAERCDGRASPALQRSVCLRCRWAPAHQSDGSQRECDRAPYR